MAQSARGLLATFAPRAADIFARASRAIGKLAGPPTEVQRRRLLSQQYLHVGVQTPEDVSSLMRLADTGYIYRLCDFWEEQRNRDCHLHTVAHRREQALVTKDWQVVPASEKRRDLRIAAWAEDAIKAMGDVHHREARDAGLDLRPLADLIAHLNSATIHGFAASELLYVRNGRRVVPAGALPMAPRRFVYAQQDGSLRWWDATGPQTLYPGKDILRDYPPGRFILHRPRVNGAGAGPREGLIRPLLWASLFRTWAMGDWLKLAELAWKPYRWGTYDPDKHAGDEDIGALETALQQLMAEGWATISNRTGLNIKFPDNASAQGGGQHEALIRFMAEEMSKAATGHTLTVEEGKRGTARTAQTGENVSHHILEIDARALEGTIQRHLLAPLIRFNFGDVPLPRFVFVTEQGVDSLALAQAIEKMRGAGLDGISAKWARAALGAPEPDVGEEVLGGKLWTPPGPEVVPVAAPGEEPENDNAVADLVVGEKALERAVRTYRVDRILVAAGMRRAA